MRIRIDHRTTYAYERTAADVIQRLKLTPRDYDGQTIRHWRLEIDVDANVRTATDAFGNSVHMVYPEGAIGRLTVRVVGEADVINSAGVVSGAAEPLEPCVYMRSTSLTAPDTGVARLADEVRGPDLLDSLHRLMVRINTEMRFDTDVTDSTTTAAQAWEAGHGVCQDFAHIFVSAARRLGAPARYVSGHLARDTAQEAAHAWGEAYVPNLGWVAFDPANAMCTTDHHLRVAVGLDYLDAAPVRGARRGGGAETLDVIVHAATQQQ